MPGHCRKIRQCPAFPVVEQDLETAPVITQAPHHDAGVGWPIGPDFHHQFEIAKCFLGDQIAAIAAAGKFLFANDIAILDEPVRGVFSGSNGNGRPCAIHMSCTMGPPGSRRP
jgi:hypothetical protein